VRALAIDPEHAKVSTIDIAETMQDIAAELGGRPSLVHSLPNGGRLYAVLDCEAAFVFSVGGSAPILGKGVIVGRRGAHGIFKSTLADERAVASIVRFSTKI
jgi:hypothetical protein